LRLWRYELLDCNMERMDFGVFSMNEWLFPDGEPSKGKRQIVINAARNSVAGAQILCNCRKVTWEWKAYDLKAPEMNKLISVYVDRNTGPLDGDYVVEQGTFVRDVTRLAPFEVYDAMEPIQEEEIIGVEGQNLGLYLRWSTEDMKAGTYEGEIRLYTENDCMAVIPVKMQVFSVSVPKKRTLRIVNWYDLKDMADYHGIELWSEEHWQIIETYGKLMHQVHQTDFLVPFMIFDCKKEKNGSYTFDFSKAERLIRLYLSLGMKYIEGGMAYYRTSWEAPGFVIDVCGVQTDALSPEGYEYAQAFYTQWYAFLQKNGWFEITQQHVADEPIQPSAVAYRILSGMIRKWMPGIRIMDAMAKDIMDGAADVWIPQSQLYDMNKERYERMRRLGDTLWYYTCMLPGGKYLNRMLDMELIRTRYLHWANLLYDFGGYLHWGLNIYHHCVGGVFTGACKPKDGIGFTLPPGDTHILYPKGKQVLISVRFEMMRAGCEDYELLSILKEKAPEEAQKILTSCVRSFSDYTTDPVKFHQTYALLLETLSRMESV